MTDKMVDNRPTKDSCEAIRLDGVVVQQNGIIRDARGWIIGRADDGWMRYQWHMLMYGVCPCCGGRTGGDNDE